MKDFAKSWEQKMWKYACSEYYRLQVYREKFSNPAFLAYINKRIEQLEEQYPQLKKDY